MVWLSFLLAVTQASCGVLAVMGPNTCSRPETYTVTMRVLEKRPVTTKTYTWCFKIPPRCTKYKQELVDHYRIQSEPRTRWVNECCPGYRPDEEDTYCVAECALGCDHGTCIAPNTCFCRSGYMGALCNKECPEGSWGPACERKCSCLNSARCNHENGHCSCPPGYRGTRCEDICPKGTYGEYCAERCSCKDGSTICHHITGACETSSSCNGSSPCQPDWAVSQAEVLHKFQDSTASSGDTPVSEPLVTTSEVIKSSDIVAGDHITDYGEQLPETTTTDNKDFVSQSDFETSVPDTQTNTESSTTSTSQSDAAFPTTKSIKGTTIIKDSSEGRFTENESHEDQLDHTKPEYKTERTFEHTGATIEADDISKLFTETSKEDTKLGTRTLLEGVTQVTSGDLEGQQSETTEGPYQQVENSTKIDDQRKKFIDEKKYKFKERMKGTLNQKTDSISQKPTEENRGWTIPLGESGESPKNFEQVQEGSHRDHMEKTVDIGKPRKVPDQKRIKDVSDIGQLKVSANQERQQGESKNTYNDFLSSFSIAAGVSTGIIMVVGVITLLARCRRPKPGQQVATAVEMEPVTSKPDDLRASMAVEETTIPVVRPLFFSPVYLPGDVSPTEANGGLILTAVFSRPASNIHDLYRQQDLLRETLAPHYDVPPPTGTRNSVCTNISAAETEHVYEELPCWRNQSPSSLSE